MTEEIKDLPFAEVTVVQGNYNVKLNNYYNSNGIINLYLQALIKLLCKAEEKKNEKVIFDSIKDSFLKLFKHENGLEGKWQDVCNIEIRKDGKNLPLNN